jgi:hypothetical protein
MVNRRRRARSRKGGCVDTVSYPLCETWMPVAGKLDHDLSFKFIVIVGVVVPGVGNIKCESALARILHSRCLVHGTAREGI